MLRSTNDRATRAIISLTTLKHEGNIAIENDGLRRIVNPLPLLDCRDYIG